MNMFKKNGGFTLVELIVVIAILAILAGVAVPVYSGYISKAQEASDMTQLDSLKTAVVFAAMEQNPTAKVKSITVEPTALTVVAEVDPNTTPASVTIDYTKIADYGFASYEFKSDNNKAVWTDTTAKWELTGSKGS